MPLYNSEKALLVEAQRLGKELAKDPGMEGWRVLFNFARRLKGIPGADELDIMDLRPAFEVFADTLVGESPEGVRNDFDGAEREYRWEGVAFYWIKVRYPDGSGPLRVAYDRACKNPLSIDPPISENFTRLVSTACYLQELQGDDNILLPVTLVGLLFGKDKMYASRLITMAQDHGFIVRVREHRYTDKEAAEYQFCFDRLRKRQPEATN